MAYNCEVKTQAPQPTLTVRTRTSVQQLPQQLGRGFGAVARYLGEQGEQPAGPPFAAYHNMDMANLDVEIGFPVSRPFPGRGEVQPGEIPGGLLATCLHVGPYSEIGRAYAALTQFVREGGYEATGVAYEWYLNDVSQTPPDKLATLIGFTLKAAS